MVLRRLTVPSLEWLAHDCSLTTSEASPLRFLAALPRRSSDTLRTQTATAEGLSAGGGLEDGWKEPIEILARPDAQISMATVVPPGAQGGAAFYIRHGRAVQFHFGKEECQLGCPLDLDSLVTTLAAGLVGPGPLEGSAELILWPSLLAVLTLLWPLSKRDVSMALPREEALARLGAAGPGAAQAPAVLAELVRSHMLRAADRELTIHPRWRPWLEATWSGHTCQLSRVALPARGRPDAAQAKHLLFTGPPGRRLHSRHVSGEELAKRAGSGAEAPAEGKAIQLTSLTAEAAQAAVRGLLDLPRPA